jgi:uncharacterized protein YecE (DUF72 family)
MQHRVKAGDMTAPAPLGVNINNNHIAKRAPSRHDGAVATDPGDIFCEPWHPTRYNAEADVFLTERQVARVAADAQSHPDARQPGGWRGLAYDRLHGSPKVYYSSYSDDELTRTEELGSKGTRTWCIFDNAAELATRANALATAVLVR